MKVKDKKEEILELLGRFLPQSKRSALSRKNRLLTRQDLSARIIRRSRTLGELRTGRENMALDLLEERMLSICKSLEERISRIENMFNSRKMGAEKQLEAGGMEFAGDLNSMMPDLITESETSTEQDKGADSAGAAPSYTLSGKIEDQTLSDIIQLISSNLKTGVFLLENPRVRAELYFREGTMYHATTESMSGQNAFFAAMSMGSGEFHFAETEKIPETKSIDGNTQFMILEALRQIDEDRGGE